MNRLLTTILLLCSTALAAQPLRVGKITIRPLDVYSDSEASKGAVYTLADRLHIETRHHVIEKFLLFREGDEYRPERLAETERNLRALHFLKSASVTASEPHDGVVDVTVTTQDAWSIAPETQAGSKGGAPSFGASVSDTNLLGLGKEVEVSWDKTSDRTRLAIAYDDPAVNSSYWRLQTKYGVNSDGHERAFAVRRPFFSFATTWSAEVSYRDLRQTDRLYEDGFEATQFGHQSHDAVISFGRAIDPNDLEANRVVTGFQLQRDTFDTAVGTESAPAARDYRYLFVRYEHTHNDFIKLNFVNRDMRYEDFNLGRQYALEAAVSPRALGSRANTGFARVSIADGLRLGETSFVVPSLAVESRFERGVQNAVAGAAVNFAQRYEGKHPGATVARVAFSGGWRMDRERQFFADGVTGLRGYRLHSFAGTRAFVANVEQRLYLGREIAQLFSPGIVAFADTGNATNGGLRSLFKLKTDVGIGLRIGLPRTPKNLLRVDLAYALNADPRGRRGLLVSFSSGQAF